MSEESEECIYENNSKNTNDEDGCLGCNAA